MITFAQEIAALVNAIENQNAPEVKDLSHHAQQKMFKAEADAAIPRIIEFMRARPVRKSWAMTSEVAEHLGVSKVKAGRYLTRMKAEDKAKMKKCGKHSEWRLI